ncbi:MAG: hypothetical protein HY600_03675, partial [Candidatus Omnitrophica bacterium]|nr:hypothetical protein [Candidatus Omnitrophota bacterium]
MFNIPGTDTPAWLLQAPEPTPQSSVFVQISEVAPTKPTVAGSQLMRTEDLFGTVTTTETINVAPYERLATGRWVSPSQLTASWTSQVDGTHTRSIAQTITHYITEENRRWVVPVVGAQRAEDLFLGRPYEVISRLDYQMTTGFDGTETRLLTPQITIQRYAADAAYGGKWLLQRPETVGRAQVDKIPSQDPAQALHDSAVITETTDYFSTKTINQTVTPEYTRLASGRWAPVSQTTFAVSSGLSGTSRTTTTIETLYTAEGRPKRQDESRTTVSDDLTGTHSTTISGERRNYGIVNDDGDGVLELTRGRRGNPLTSEYWGLFGFPAPLLVTFTNPITGHTDTRSGTVTTFETLFGTVGLTTQRNAWYDADLWTKHRLVRPTTIITVTDTQAADGTTSHQVLFETRTYFKGGAQPPGTLKTAEAHGTSVEAGLFGVETRTAIRQRYTMALPNTPRLAWEERIATTTQLDGTVQRTTTTADLAYTTADDRLEDLTQVVATDRFRSGDLKTPALYEHQDKPGMARAGLLKSYTSTVNGHTDGFDGSDTETTITQTYRIRGFQPILTRQETHTTTRTVDGTTIDHRETLAFQYTRKGMSVDDPELAPLWANTDYVMRDASGRATGFKPEFRQQDGTFKWDNLLLAVTQDGAAKTLTNGIDGTVTKTDTATTYRIIGGRQQVDTVRTTAVASDLAGTVTTTVNQVRYLYTVAGMRLDDTLDDWYTGNPLTKGMEGRRRLGDIMRDSGYLDRNGNVLPQFRGRGAANQRDLQRIGVSGLAFAVEEQLQPTGPAFDWNGDGRSNEPRYGAVIRTTTLLGDDIIGATRSFRHGFSIVRGLVFGQDKPTHVETHTQITGLIDLPSRSLVTVDFQYDSRGRMTRQEEQRDQTAVSVDGTVSRTLSREERRFGIVNDRLGQTPGALEVARGERWGLTAAPQGLAVTYIDPRTGKMVTTTPTSGQTITVTLTTTLFDTASVTTQTINAGDYDHGLLTQFGLYRPTRLTTATTTHTIEGFVSTQTMTETRRYSQGREEVKDVAGTDLIVSGPWPGYAAFRPQFDRDGNGRLDAPGLLLGATASGAFSEESLTASTTGQIAQTFQVIFNTPRISSEDRHLNSEAFDGQMTTTRLHSTYGYTTGDERIGYQGRYVSATDLPQVAEEDRAAIYADPDRPGFARRGLLKTFQQTQTTTMPESWTGDVTTSHVTQEYQIRRLQPVLNRQTTVTDTETFDGTRSRTEETLHYGYTRRGLRVDDPVFDKTDYREWRQRDLEAGRPSRFFDGETFTWDNLLLAVTPETVRVTADWDDDGRVDDAHEGAGQVTITQTLFGDVTRGLAQTEYRIINGRAVVERVTTTNETRTIGGEVTVSKMALHYVYSRAGDDRADYAHTNYADYGHRFFDARGKMRASGLLKRVEEEVATLSVDWNRDGVVDDTLHGEGQLSLTRGLFGEVTSAQTLARRADGVASSRIVIDGRDLVESTWTIVQGRGVEGGATTAVNFQAMAFSRGEGAGYGGRGDSASGAQPIRVGEQIVSLHELLAVTDYLGPGGLVKAQFMDKDGRLRRGLLLAVHSQNVPIPEALPGVTPDIRSALAGPDRPAVANTSMTHSAFQEWSFTRPMTEAELQSAGLAGPRVLLIGGRPRELFSGSVTTTTDAFGGGGTTSSLQLNRYTTGAEPASSATTDLAGRARIQAFLAGRGVSTAALPAEVGRLPEEFFERDGKTLQARLIKNGTLRPGLLIGAVAFSKTASQSPSGHSESTNVQFLTAIHGAPRPIVVWTTSASYGLLGDHSRETTATRFSYSQGGETAEQLVEAGAAGYLDGLSTGAPTIRPQFLGRDGKTLRAGLLMGAAIETPPGSLTRLPGEPVFGATYGEDAVGFHYVGKIETRTFFIDALGRAQSWVSQERRKYYDLAEPLSQPWKDTTIETIAGDPRRTTADGQWILKDGTTTRQDLPERSRYQLWDPMSPTDRSNALGTALRGYAANGRAVDSWITTTDWAVSDVWDRVSLWVDGSLRPTPAAFDAVPALDRVGAIDQALARLPGLLAAFEPTLAAHLAAFDQALKEAGVAEPQRAPMVAALGARARVYFSGSAETVQSWNALQALVAALPAHQQALVKAFVTSYDTTILGAIHAALKSPYATGEQNVAYLAQLRAERAAAMQTLDGAVAHQTTQHYQVGASIPLQPDALEALATQLAVPNQTPEQLQKLLAPYGLSAADIPGLLQAVGPDSRLSELEQRAKAIISDFEQAWLTVQGQPVVSIAGSLARAKGPSLTMADLVSALQQIWELGSSGHGAEAMEILGRTRQRIFDHYGRSIFNGEFRGPDPFYIAGGPASAGTIYGAFLGSVNRMPGGEAARLKTDRQQRLAAWLNQHRARPDPSTWFTPEGLPVSTRVVTDT